MSKHWKKKKFRKSETEDDPEPPKEVLMAQAQDYDYKRNPSAGGKAFLRKISGGKDLTKRLTQKGLLHLFNKPDVWSDVPGAKERLMELKPKVPIP